MRILFILPSFAHSPVGGFKIVYEYANHLSRRGHQVGIDHLVGLGAAPNRWRQAIGGLKYFVRRLQSKHSLVPWFSLDERVLVRALRPAQKECVLGYDAVIATAWQTAEWLGRIELAPSNGFYLIQHLETWDDKARVVATWRTPLHKIAIARWLQQFAMQLGESAEYIPNGLDFETFYLERPPETRCTPLAMMLYHTADNKGSADGLRALIQARDSVPALRAILFGVSPRPADLPQWMEYYRQPEQKLLRELYNQAQVFIAPSWSEGWGLPASEAMMCGAALAATDVGGHREFAKHGQTALLSPPRDSEALASNIVSLLMDPTLRIKIAVAGHQNIKQFTWERATDSLESSIQRSCQSGKSRAT